MFKIYFDTRDEQMKHILFQIALFDLGEKYGRNKDRKSLKKLFKVLKNSKSKLYKMLNHNLNKRVAKIGFRFITKKAIMDSYKEGFKAVR